MRLDWLDWSNPVALWWSFLLVVSAFNIALLFQLHAWYRNSALNTRTRVLGSEPLVILSAAYVLGCAFRSMLPRADVQRICLFDTWLSSVLVGRSVATIAELCFALQWAIVLRELARLTHLDAARNTAKLIVPLIMLAECCSWYAVISTNFLGNVLENSLWTATFLIIALTLSRLMSRFRGIVQSMIAAVAVGIAGYVVFMATVDVPLYYARWQAQLAAGQHFFALLPGLRDVATRWVVTHNIARWRQEIPWMSLYFSVAVWTSLALGGFHLVKHRLPRYRVRAPLAKLARRTIAIPVRSS
ncbi:MAG TPA: hypothetical protein VGJ20_34690 [Xanthobacteraceae bacterium]|jgi:hypothetical protein